MRYWLFKTEPGVFSFSDLYRCAGQTEPWDGVRNYQARNFMRDEMKKGDLGFFYHSNCASPGIVGIIQIVREGYPDFTAFDRSNKYYDPRSSLQNPRWYMVDVKYMRPLQRMIGLGEMRLCEGLSDMLLMRHGMRLSVMPVSEVHWQLILGMETDA